MEKRKSEWAYILSPTFSSNLVSLLLQPQLLPCPKIWSTLKKKSVMYTSLTTDVMSICLLNLQNDKP